VGKGMGYENGLNYAKGNGTYGKGNSRGTIIRRILIVWNVLFDNKMLFLLLYHVFGGWVGGICNKSLE
jgi:hypothetical protein